MDISNFMRADLVFLDVDAHDKNQVFSHIVEGMVECHVIEEPDAFLGEILDRELQSPTCIGRGIALPHTRTIFVDQPVIAFARTKEAVSFSSKSKDAVKLVFLMGTPKNDPNTYLQILGNLCRLLREDAFRDELKEADSPGKILALFAKEKMN